MAKKIIGNYNPVDVTDHPHHPPSVIDSLVAEITRIGLHKFKELPQATSSQELARFWITNNQPANQQFESPKEVPAIGKDGSRWVCPYHHRLVGTLRAFALLSPADRKTILSCIKEEKVWWRGEPIKNYFSIILETKRMRSIGIKPYREEALSKMRKFLGKPIVDEEARLEREAIEGE